MAEANRDLVLSLGTFAHILDRSKGHINVNVGPYKTTVSETDAPVKWNGSTYERIASADQAIQPFVTAEEGDYVVLQNPAADGKPPKEGTSSVATSLEVGRKINIPGPISFPLWPGQSASVTEGHLLRTNQYLVVRVYNDQQASANWGKAVVKTVDGKPVNTPVPNLVMGQLLVIKGTDVAFYIPPTGVEVVKDERGQYTREAATLERLEYAILLDEDGNKRYIQGPAVVFPKPTETFVVKDNTRKFRALELSEISGIHVKVIADYDDKKVGDELFITGNETAIYYPRPEHAIIKYDDREVHHAIAIPEGDARYVLERLTGKVKMVRGPMMFLPDPRKEVIVKRVLDPKIVAYLYPGNSAAQVHNQELAREVETTGSEYLTYSNASPTAYMMSSIGASGSQDVRGRTKGLTLDSIDRKNVYTPPRTVTLNNKFDGVVNIQLWTGYAMLIVSNTGKRRIVVGPTNVQLEYDELPQAFELSTGKPKNTDNLLRTVYLKVKNNQVSDIIRVTTKDMVDVEIKVSYRVDFQGDSSEKWFEVDNYVKFLCDHARSLLKNVAKHHGITDFYNNTINIVRDTVLGVKTETKRTGRVFEENDMCIYDVEVLDVKISNPEIAGLLQSAQHDAVADTISVTNRERELQSTTKIEKITQAVAEAKAETAEKLHELELNKQERSVTERLNLAKNESLIRMKDIEDRIVEATKTLEANKAKQSNLDEIAQAELKREIAKDEARVKNLQEEAEVETQALSDKMKAMTPDLLASLKIFGDKALLEKLSEALAPMAIAQNVPVVEVAKKMFAGTPLESILESLSKSVATATSH
jgi:major vault protein